MKIIIQFDNKEDFAIHINKVSPMGRPVPVNDPNKELKSAIMTSIMKVTSGQPLDDSYPKFDLLNCFVKDVKENPDTSIEVNLGYEYCNKEIKK